VIVTVLAPACLVVTRQAGAAFFPPAW